MPEPAHRDGQQDLDPVLLKVRHGPFDVGGVNTEVLPAEEYRDEHIEGAANIPLKRLNRETTSHLDKARPVIVY